jgi:hypothetical protein
LDKYDDIGKEIFGAERNGISLDSVSVDGLDSTAGQLYIKSLASGSAYGQASGDYLYFNPVVLDRLTDNPFKLKERKFPVDMSYGRNIVCVAMIRAPQGFEIKELPKDINLGGEDIRYTRKTVAAADTILTETRLAIAVSLIPPGVYESLKSFYDQIVAAESEQIVLQRKPQTPSQPQPIIDQKKSGKGGKNK